MKDLLKFIKDIFTCKDENFCPIGLCQFKTEDDDKPKTVKKAKKQPKDIKISDLMRRAY